REQALAILSTEFGSSRLFVLKDPRICRLLPFWIEVLEGFGAIPHVVCPIRNPLEVAASLKSRNGTDASLGQLIWLRHVLEAEIASRDLPRAFIRYKDLLHGWRSVTLRLGSSF